MAEYEIKLSENDKVSIYTGNADGSIPGIKDYTGTVKKFLFQKLALVKTDDGELIEVHVKRLTKL